MFQTVDKAYEQDGVDGGSTLDNTVEDTSAGQYLPWPFQPGLYSGF